jgi:hypothetical protein
MREQKPLLMSEPCSTAGGVGMGQPIPLMVIEKQNKSEYTFGNSSLCPKDHIRLTGTVVD